MFCIVVKLHWEGSAINGAILFRIIICTIESILTYQPRLAYPIEQGKIGKKKRKKKGEVGRLE